MKKKILFITKFLGLVLILLLISSSFLYSSEAQILHVLRDGTYRINKGAFHRVNKGDYYTVVKKINNRWAPLDEVLITRVFEEYCLGEPLIKCYPAVKGNILKRSHLSRRKTSEPDNLFKKAMSALDFSKPNKCYTLIFEGFRHFSNSTYLLCALSRYYCYIEEYRASAEVLRVLSRKEDLMKNLQLKSLFFNLMGITAGELGYLSGAIRHFDRNIKDHNNLFSQQRFMLAMSYLLKASILYSEGYTRFAENLYEKGRYTSLHVIETGKFLNSRSKLRNLFNELIKGMRNGSKR